MKSLYFAALVIFLLGREVLCLGLPVKTASCEDGLAIVLSIDTSASMDSQDRLQKLELALRDYISKRIPCGTKLGMVTFGSHARLLSNLTVINEESREELIKNIPTLAQGEACIPCGLVKGIEVLQSNNSSESAIVLITDAEKSELDLADGHAMQSANVSGIRVVALMLGRGDNEKFEDIDKLTKSTNGFSRYIQDDKFSKEMLEALTSVQEIFSDKASTSVMSLEITSEITSSSLGITSTETISTTSLGEKSNSTSSENLISTTSLDEISSSTSEASTFLEDGIEITSSSLGITSTETMSTTGLGEKSNSTSSENLISTTASLDEITPSTSEASTTVSVYPTWLMVTVVVLVTVVVVAIVSISILYFRKQRTRSCAKRGCYQPPKYQHGDIVRADVATNDPYYVPSQDAKMYS